MQVLDQLLWLSLPEALCEAQHAVCNLCQWQFLPPGCKEAVNASLLAKTAQLQVKSVTTPALTVWQQLVEHSKTFLTVVKAGLALYVCTGVLYANYDARVTQLCRYKLSMVYLHGQQRLV